MNECVMDTHEIRKILPHRYPFLLVDRVTALEPSKYLTAIKNITVNEPFFQGHFPDAPVMPGVLMIEAMAQAAAIFSYKSAGQPMMDEMREDSIHVLAGIDKARFKRMVVPGDQLEIRVELLKARPPLMMKVHVVATVDGELACEADLMSMRAEVKA